jgi:hypothetical protein
MLQQSMNRHSQIIIPPETKFFFSFLGHSRACQLRHLRRINADLQINLSLPPQGLRTIAGAQSFYKHMAECYVARLRRNNTVHFGEKTPEHTGRLKLIQKTFPTGKIIFLYRDGRDVALSLSKVPWMSRNLYVNFMVWLYYYRILWRMMAKQSQNICYVRYEDLVNNPPAELRRLLGFLGLPYEAAVAEGYGNREGIPQRELAWKGRALDKIARDRIGTWRRELSLNEIMILERLGRRALPALGYELMSVGKEPLSCAFLLKLSWDLLCLLYRLPWHSISAELLGRSLCLPSIDIRLVSRLVDSSASLPAWTTSLELASDDKK